MPVSDKVRAFLLWITVIMKKETYLAWMACEDKGCFGIYDGCLEAQAKGVKVKPHLKQLLKKAEGALAPDEVWNIDAGTWYFGAEAVAIIKAEIARN